VKVEGVSELDVASELLPSLVVLMIKRTTLVLDEAGESLHVVNGSGGGNLGSETVSSDSSEANLLLVHEADNIVGHVLHVVGWEVVRLTLVAVINEPNVSSLEDLVASLGEELLEVGSRLSKLR
jgi:hypothetical protein